MIPVALAAVWYGAPWTSGLAALAAAIMAWEWGRLVGRSRRLVDDLLLAVIAALSVVAGAYAAAWLGLVLAALGIALQHRLGRDRNAAPLWTAFGLVWIIVPCIGFVWLRDAPAHGAATVYWLLALVWAIDTAAYAAGRTLGGPKLAPRISPKKTWAGLLGGVLAAVIIGAIAALVVGTGSVGQLALLSGVLAIVEQIGDMAESFAKRRFGAKDSSNLIPGHGGLLDRLDGMLAVVLAVVILSLVTGGSVLTWR
ncbi:phosphatidate cytidylyltransferase [Aliidongia dinghuensis]|uniref:Phosphatidate cytidylyltransferase n=1 Tax=Aliidongia dinghuensis TaxID=1867774 RepID=A0A8J3E4P6_9PROT|nr:phosphatidate cytidylyltransferase [Aliidongia dinghuensis]